MPEVGAVSKLPLEIATHSDLLRVYRELKNIIDELSQASLVADRPQTSQTRVSEGLLRLAQVNSIDINEADQRSALLAALEHIKESAPAVHVSFASEPSPGTIRAIATWFRQEASPLAVLQIGVQPSIVAGCVVRTPNKVFNLTLSKQLEATKDILRERIKAL